MSVEKERSVGWPPDAAPNRTPVYAYNAILIAADPMTVWSFLIRAPHWPEWYPYSANVRVAQGAAELSLGAKFDWKTFDLPCASQVLEWEPGRRIGWNAKAARFLANAYHRFTIEQTASGYTQVVTEETQRGLLPRLLPFYLAPRLYRQHETWLQRLKCVSENF